MDRYLNETELTLLRTTQQIALSIWLILMATSVTAQEDIVGASDHPLLSRYPGFHISNFSEADFDQAQLITSVMEADRFETTTFVGQISNIAYQANATDVSAFQIIANYKRALDDLDAEIIAFCVGASECGGEGWQFSIFHRTAPNIGNLLRGFVINFFEDYGILTAKVEQDGLTAHVMILAFAQPTGGERSIYQSIVTSATIQDDLIGIGTVEDVSAKIEETGTVVLDGVLFDFDTANLTGTSQETLNIVFDYLTENSLQQFYVVGHTDSIGDYQYNVSLSKNRAASVIQALRSRGIAAERLTSVGIGPVAPVASNDTETGQALNRRVELVLRP